MGRALLIALSLAALGSGVQSGEPATRAPDGDRRVPVPCTRARGTPRHLCAQLWRPLDPDAPNGERIPVYFEFYPHSGPGTSRGTLVATEGGPGYPATQSRDDYLTLFGPLRARRDVVIMDNRGTGRSGAVDCHELQTAPRWTEHNVAVCGGALGARAALYGTAHAADDLAAILESLGAGPVDLYGDSYGTYFEQVFALRHPRALRSIVLDGAYPLGAADYAWYPTYAPAMRDKFDIACRRSASCAKLPGSSIDHIEPALAMLRQAPFQASAADLGGAPRAFTADAAALAIVMFGGAPANATVRETDAAARAFAAGDRAPLLRLMAETLSAVDSRDPGDDPKQWSAGLAAAVMCVDPPQVFDMRLTPGERAAERDRVVERRRREHPDTYAPFTIDEFRAMPLDYSFIDECAGWPALPPAHPGPIGPAEAVYPDVPALVVSGDLDAITTRADGAAVARAFPRGRQIVVANGFHVNALPRGRSRCAPRLVREFIAAADPAAAALADCVPAAAPVRLVPRFAVTADELPPADALPGNAASDGQLRLVEAVLLTVGDALARIRDSTGGPGLRGGRYHVIDAEQRVLVRLAGLRWTQDVAVTGEVARAKSTGHAVRGHVRFLGPGGTAGDLDLRWEDAAPDARATVRGQLDGMRVAAAADAP